MSKVSFVSSCSILVLFVVVVVNVVAAAAVAGWASHAAVRIIGLGGSAFGVRALVLVGILFEHRKVFEQV